MSFWGKPIVYLCERMVAMLLGISGPFVYLSSASTVCCLLSFELELELELANSPERVEKVDGQIAESEHYHNHDEHFRGLLS